MIRNEKYSNSETINFKRIGSGEMESTMIKEITEDSTACTENLLIATVAL